MKDTKIRDNGSRVETLPSGESKSPHKHRDRGADSQERKTIMATSKKSTKENTPEAAELKLSALKVVAKRFPDAQKVLDTIQERADNEKVLRNSEMNKAIKLGRVLYRNEVPEKGIEALQVTLAVNAGEFVAFGYELQRKVAEIGDERRATRKPKGDRNRKSNMEKQAKSSQKDRDKANADWKNHKDRMTDADSVDVDLADIEELEESVQAE